MIPGGWICKNKVEPNWTVDNDPCTIELGNGWRIPSYTEWDNVKSYGGWTNWSGPWNSALKLHSAGYISCWALEPTLQNRGQAGSYWTSTSVPKEGGTSLQFDVYGFSLGTDGPLGSSLRCIFDPENTNPVTPQVGDSYGGGIVFYVDESGYGLIAAPADQSTGSEWGCYGTLIGETFVYMGTGPVNTAAIVDGCSETGIAARICSELILDGYDDWYLPSEYELNELYYQKEIVGGFTAGNYWSSTETDLNNAEAVSFSDGTLISQEKDNSANIRAIRTFCIVAAPGTPIQITHEVSDDQIVWNWRHAEGATGYRWNTVNDYATSEDMGLSLSKTQTGLSGFTEYYAYVWAYNDCGHSVPAELWAMTLPNCYEESLTISHIAGNVAPVTKTVTYDITYNVPGEESKCWITSNLGADREALAVDDASEESAGWYWKFNAMQGYKHDNINPTPAWTFSLIDENSDWMAANDPCTLELGSTWRLPTRLEWSHIMVAGGWNSWWVTYYGPLKLHAAGYIMNLTGVLDGRGVYGQYWSSIQLDNQNAWYLNFSSTSCTVGNTAKSHGIPVRCIKE